MRFSGDLFGLGKGAMIAPQVIVVQRFQPLADGNHTGAGSIERDGRNGAAFNASALEHIASSGGKRPHLVRMRLGSKVRIFAAAVERVRGRRGSNRSPLAIDQSNANAESAEINPGDDSHGWNTPVCVIEYANQTTTFRYFFVPGSIPLSLYIRPGLASELPAEGLAGA